MIGTLGTLWANSRRVFLAAALMMVLFFHAARLAMVVFDPYLSSRPLAMALLQAPQGTLIVQAHYSEFSSVFFYTNLTGLLLTDRRVNLEYGSYAPGAPTVFINDKEFQQYWQAPERCYCSRIRLTCRATSRCSSPLRSMQLRRAAEKFC